MQCCDRFLYYYILTVIFLHQPLFKTELSLSLFVGRGACPSRCINPCHSRNHCKRTIIPLLRTITLASLVKGEVLSPEIIRATTVGIAFLPHHNFSFFIFNLHYLSPLDTSKIIWYYNLNYSFKKNRSFSPFFYTYFNVFADIL